MGVILSLISAPRAIKLLTSVATDLIHLLPTNYPSVRDSDRIKQKFNRRSSLFVILNSPSLEVNEKAVREVRDYLLQLDSVDKVDIEKQGYDFFDQKKLLLLDLDDVYKIHDKLKDKIQKEKLGAMFIDFEDAEDVEKEGENGFGAMIDTYKKRFAQGVQSRYRRSEDGKVYVLDVYPKSFDSGLGFFKKFGDEIDAHLKKYNFSQYPDMKYGYAGAIKTRVDQYDALIDDIAVAGTISMVSIFIVLYFYFSGMIPRKKRGFVNGIKLFLIRLVPVAVVFVPMIMSTLMAFCVCSFFFDQLNVVTSFLFAIIFGLGVDIGIHLITRFVQDRGRGLSIAQVHRNVLTRTGKSCATSVLTTVTSFYILVVNDFRGFSEFGWIAGNGLIIALICYLLFEPSLVLLIDRFHLLGKSTFDLKEERPISAKHRKIPYAKWVLALCFILVAVSIYTTKNVGFEWNFNNLKMKLPEREHQRELLKSTLGRVNSPASYLIENPIEARELGRFLRKHKEQDLVDPTIDYYRSYYDIIPYEQEEKLAVWQDVRHMLDDDALNTLKSDQKKLVNDLKTAIDQTSLIEDKDIPSNVRELFWGNKNDSTHSIAYAMPLGNLELDNGNNARHFYDDVGVVNAFDKPYHAVSDAIVFAEVLVTLFRDSKIAITLSTLILTILIALHFRDVKRTSFVLLGLLSGIFWMFGLMNLFDLKLNFYNMIVIPAMIGMGEDNSVHIVDRYEELGRSSIFDVLKTSGWAAFMASLCTILGYAGLCFSHHPGLNSIGWMAITGMGTCLLGSLVVLPILLQVFLTKQKNTH